MALTFFRWVALAIAGALVAMVAILRGDGAERWTRVPGATTYDQRDRARTHLLQAAARARLLHLRDSVVRAAGPARTRDDRLIIGTTLAADRRMLEGLFATAMAGRGAAALPVDVVVVHDTGAVIPGVGGLGVVGGTQTSYFLPDERTGNRCVVLLRYNPPAHSVTQRRLAGRRLASRTRRGRLLGPCAFYRDFGMPGAQVRGWLDRHEWSLGRSADWGRAPAVWRQEWTPNALQLIFDPQWDSRLRAVTSPEGYRCATGDRAECERVMVEGLPARSILARPGSAWGNVVDAAGGWSTGWYSSYRVLGPQEETVLAEMVRTLGPERFRSFWQSSQDPASAFRAATGQPLGTWVHEWALRVYGPTERGPAVHASVVSWIVAFVALALVGAMRAAHARRVR